MTFVFFLEFVRDEDDIFWNVYGSIKPQQRVVVSGV